MRVSSRAPDAWDGEGVDMGGHVARRGSFRPVFVRELVITNGPDGQLLCGEFMGNGEKIGGREASFFADLKP